MDSFFDACVGAPEDLPGGKPVLPDGLAGAALFGAKAKARRDELARWHPDLLWCHAESLDRIVAENHARFPSRSARVIDFAVEGPAMADYLKRPEEWWPLCETLRRTARLLRLRLPPGLAALSGAKRAIKRFEETRFCIDPFVHGPVAGWQGHVRLAEYSNVTLTTRGVFPGEGSKWSADEAAEALRFVAGEVGAGVLVYASGSSWNELGCEKERAGREWFAGLKEPDAEERALVLYENAEEIFGKDDGS